MLYSSTKEQFRRFVNSAAVLGIRCLGIAVGACLIVATLAALALIGVGFEFVLSWIIGMYNISDWLTDRLEALGITVLVVLMAAGALAGLLSIFKLLKVTFGGDEDDT